jgi:hypothetical protein
VRSKHPWRVLQTPIAIAWGEKGRALPNLRSLLFSGNEKGLFCIAYNLSSASQKNKIGNTKGKISDPIVMMAVRLF